MSTLGALAVDDRSRRARFASFPLAGLDIERAKDLPPKSTAHSYFMLWDWDGTLERIHRGSQYAAGDYRDILQAAAIVQSMSRKGNCWDNAPMESFFGTLKTELIRQDDYPNRDAARRDLFAYIEGYYNRQRRHSAIGYITPEQAEAKSA